jgi:hypothetical protein
MATMLLAAVDPASSTDAPAASAAPAPPPAAAAAPAQAKKRKDSDVVCWNEMPTGSHFAKRICATREELELNQRTSQDAMHGRANSPKGSFGPS